MYFKWVVRPIAWWTGYYVRWYSTYDVYSIYDTVIHLISLKVFF